MRSILIKKMKFEIENNLKKFLREEGIALYIAANDNMALLPVPFVELEEVANTPLQGNALLAEIKVVLGILGKPGQCTALVNGLYEALHPHNLTQRELTVLLMSLHVETAHFSRPRCLKKRAVMRYVVEQILTPSEESAELKSDDIAQAECC